MLRIQLTLTTRDAPKGVLALHITIIQSPSTAVIVVLTPHASSQVLRARPLHSCVVRAERALWLPGHFLAILLSSLSSRSSRNPRDTFAQHFSCAVGSEPPSHLKGELPGDFG